MRSRPEPAPSDRSPQKRGKAENGRPARGVPRDWSAHCWPEIGPPESAAGEICLPAEVAAKLAQRVHADHLTAREVDVLSLLVRGLNNKDIAHQLLIGENTVETHLKGIFSKLGVLSRAEAIAVASRRGLV